MCHFCNSSGRNVRRRALPITSIFAGSAECSGPLLTARYRGVYRRLAFGPCALQGIQHNVKSRCCFRRLGQAGTAKKGSCRWNLSLSVLMTRSRCKDLIEGNHYFERDEPRDNKFEAQGPLRVDDVGERICSLSDYSEFSVQCVNALT